MTRKTYNLVPNFLESDAIPNELREVIGLLIEGKITSMLLVMELTDGSIADGVYMDMEGESDRYAVLGGLEALKRDYLRIAIPSRLEYISPDDFVGDDEDDEEDEDEDDDPTHH